MSKADRAGGIHAQLQAEARAAANAKLLEMLDALAAAGSADGVATVNAVLALGAAEQRSDSEGGK